MNKLILLALILLSIFSYSRSIDKTPKFYQVDSRLTSEDYQAGTLIIKEKPQFKGVLQGNDTPGREFLDEVISNLGIHGIKKEYPNHKSPELKTDKLGNPLVDISTINQVKFDESINIEDAINQLLSTNMFEYVEPLFLHKLLYTPNDTLATTNQYYLDLINAFEAWDISKGDTNIVIGITDTGIKKNHDDIINKIKYNYADPINGIDDDGDGYVDNFYGWDIGNTDNDPELELSQHGVWVAGLAGMETDNVSFGAGVGFNCKILPIRIDSAGQLPRAYNGIVYAADHGSHIINCSWGSANTWSQYGQDIINYATFTKNALVVCAAGNSNADEAFYPASFNNALSVGMIDSTDIINSISTYNYKIDVVAPGGQVETTHNDNGWINTGAGSSFSSPIVAGIAAIIKSENPSWTPMQIAGQIKVTSDITDTLAGNLAYKDKLGDGRVNMYRALTEMDKPYLEMNSYSLSNGTPLDGDVVELTAEFTNYLSPSSSDLRISLESSSPYINITNETAVLGIIGTLETGDNISEPFAFEILPGAPRNTEVELIIRHKDGDYKSKEVISFTLNKDYADLNINDVNITITSNGRLGYSEDNQLGGSGVTYQTAGNALYQMGFMVAQNSSKVSFSINNEFALEEAIEIIEPGNESDKDIRTYIDDSPAGGNALGISVRNKAMAWNKEGHKNYVITEFTIYNNSGGDLIDIYPALYADWDIVNYATNEVYFDHSRNMGVAFNPGGTYAGIRMLTDTNKTKFYAINADGSHGSISTYDGYTHEEQFNTASGAIERFTAPTGDIAEVIGAGPIAISNGDSSRITFAIILGNDSASVVAGSDSAAAQYYNIRHVESGLTSIVNVSCNGDQNGSATVDASFGIEPYFYSWNDSENQTTATATDLSAGHYIVTVSDAVGNSTTSSVVIGEPDSLKIFVDSVYLASCNGYCDATADIRVEGGTMGYDYEWSDPSIPSTLFPLLCVGEHQLIITDAGGCTDSISFSTTEPEALVITVLDTIHQTHPDTCNGFASIEATGGIQPYSYTWDNESSSDTTFADSLCRNEYTISVIDSKGCIVSKDIEIELDYEEPIIEDPASIKDQVNEEILVFPIPSNDRVNIQSKKVIQNIQIYDIQGKMILEKDIQELSFIIDNLNSGIYQMIMYLDSGIVSKRFEIVK